MPSLKTSSRRKSANKSSYQPPVRVAVVGVGGGGGNAISRMSEEFPRGVEFIAINTDIQDLEFCSARRKIHIGKNATKGLGAGMNPDLGARSAEENKTEIAEALEGVNLIFLTSCFGGGTGTGAMPVVAEIAKEQGAVTVAVITKPFSFEGSQRTRIAQEGIARLRDKVDALIVIPNDRIFSIINKDTSIIKAFTEIDEVLKNAVAGIVDLVVSPGIVNVDFADVQTIIRGAGSAIVGLGIASGAERSVDAARQAINSPLLEINADGAKGVLFGVSGGRDLKMSEINEAAKVITESVDPSAKIIFGAYNDRRLKQGQVKITLIATGFSSSRSLSGSLFGGGVINDDSSDNSSDIIVRRPLPKSGPINPPPSSQDSLSTTDKIASFFGSRPKPEESKDEPMTGGAISKRDNQKNNDSKSDSMWDIPTFLRRKKK